MFAILLLSPHSSKRLFSKKKGGYAIQEWFGDCKILEIEGNYNNVMGLNSSLLYSKLSQLVDSHN